MKRLSRLASRINVIPSLPVLVPKIPLFHLSFALLHILLIRVFLRSLDLAYQLETPDPATLTDSVRPNVTRWPDHSKIARSCWSVNPFSSEFETTKS